jgi:hypothetical protein
MTKKLEFKEMDGGVSWETEKLPVGRYRIIENRDGTFESILWLKGFEDIRPPDNWYGCLGGYIFLGREIIFWEAAKAVCELHYNRQAED